MSAKVKLSALVENIECQSEELYAYLNRRTGQIVMVSAEELRMAENEETEDGCGEDDTLREAIAIIEDEDDNYLELPDEEKINEYGIMEDFCYEIEKPKTQDILYRAIRGKGAFRRFKDAVYDLGIQDNWYAFREQKLKEFAMEWCRDHKVDFEDDLMPKEVVPATNAKVMLHEEEPVIPGRYRHYKGGEYEVIAVAMHSETMEEYVVYRALYGEGEYWIRPKGMFMEKVTVSGKFLPRFEYIGESGKAR